jgi:membrane protein implicated in regulation of membrane protease activity
VEDWLQDNAWAVWTALMVALGLAEMISLDLVLLMLGTGAGAGALSSLLLSLPVWGDLLVALVVATGMLALVRPSLVKKLHNGPELTTGHSTLVGQRAVVLEPVDEQHGLVKLAGEEWTARVFDPSMHIDAGTQVEVFEIDGATAVVYPMD